ncbi:hypothetical protein C0J52_14391 [Blattella germanica]|nr:hypothetical protein C0J52_14391 [Blattella germanica]
MKEIQKNELWSDLNAYYMSILESISHSIALREKQYSVFEEVHGVSDDGSTRRIDMTAFQVCPRWTWHEAELDKNCLFSKIERREIKKWKKEMGKKKNTMSDK